MHTSAAQKCWAFSPVLHISPHRLSKEIGRLVSQKLQPENILEIRCKESHQCYKFLSNGGAEYILQVAPELGVRVLQRVTFNAEGARSYDVRCKPCHRFLHLDSGS